jgi:hypothetical protein
MIDREHPLGVVRQAKLLGISQGTDYHRPRPTRNADSAPMRRIGELHLAHPLMSARMLRRKLLCEGIRVGWRHLDTSAGASRPCALSQAPAIAIAGMSFTLICGARGPSAVPTKSGRWLRPASAWPGDLST